MPNRNLVQMLTAQDTKLAAALIESRSTFAHAGTRGDQVEMAFRQFLDAHLPRHFTVGTGEIIDLHDTRSPQTDVVVANSDQPFRSGLHDSGLYLIEGVAAAGEIKSRLTMKDLHDTLTKGTQFKKLRHTNQVGDERMTNPSDAARFYSCPPYFLFAFETSVAISTMMETLRSASPVPVDGDRGRPLAPVDGVFILGRGCAIDYGDGEGALRWVMLDEAGAISIPGWQWRDTKTVVAEFLIWLGCVIPRVRRFGSVAPEYLIQHMQALRGAPDTSSEP